jgi:ribosome-associated protein
MRAPLPHAGRRRNGKSGLARAVPPRPARPMSKATPAASPANAVPEEITIRAEPIELSQLLKFAGLFESGGEAKHAILEGRVAVNGVVERTVRKQIKAGTTVSCSGRTLLVRL